MRYEPSPASLRSAPSHAVRERRRPSLKGWVGEGVGVPRSALLCLLCLILYAPGLATIPPVDRDEARFAQATRQILETGDFIRIRVQEEARNKKSMGIHWLQAVAVALFSTPGSTAIWPYRLPSALAVFGTATRLAAAAQGIDSSPARAWPWSVTGETRRSENPWRGAG
jgi:hypothetical protein